MSESNSAAEREQAKRELAEALHALFAEVANIAKAQGQKQEFEEFLANGDLISES